VIASATVVALLVAGVLFSLLGAVGVLRMPDLFTRLQASTKAGTLGVGCIMVAAAVHFGDLGVIVRAVLVVAFLLLTAPVAAHVIARAAYGSRIPLWDRTGADDLRSVRRRPTDESHDDGRRS
jgi:multicomponent Na+:H+ antiporter subunit G